MYVLVNPRHGSMTDPASVLLMKGTSGVGTQPLLLSEDTLQVEKCDTVDFRRRVGDCSNIRNVYLADDFYLVTGDDPYKGITEPVVCNQGVLTITESGGLGFKVSDTDYKLDVCGGDIHFNGVSILDSPSNYDFEDVHLAYAYRFKGSLFMRYIVRTVNNLAGLLTLIFTVDGDFKDALGVGACMRAPHASEGRIRAFTDGSARY